MLLENKVAVIHGGGGSIGSVVAKTFAREGAKVYLAGRTRSRLDEVASAINEAGGFARAAEVDALDRDAVNAYLAAVVREAGRVDLSFTAIGIPQEGIQGTALLELSTESFMKPIETYAKSYFITATAAARHMVQQRSGVILVHTPEVSRLGIAFSGGMAPSWAAMETLNRNLSMELGQFGVRAVTLRSTGLPETKTIDVVYNLHAKALGITKEQFQQFLESMNHIKRSTTLKEVAEAAVFAASDRASSMTAATMNLTGGAVVDW
ncbi:MAG TPA: SDR family oxidoreductase [Candidatus Acidoferrales bacterium]|nr:SDR family oxidoreductase [Candidatus Acidoferrales bacterium]